jgi:hypothetical protein
VRHNPIAEHPVRHPRHRSRPDPPRRPHRLECTRPTH